MINVTLAKKLIKERSNLHPNDPSVEKYWIELTELLSANEAETKDFLSKCSSEELYWISEIFEDISYRFQSKSFVNYLKTLQDLFPELDLSVDIHFAEKMLLEND